MPAGLRLYPSGAQALSRQIIVCSQIGPARATGSFPSVRERFACGFGIAASGPKRLKSRAGLTIRYWSLTAGCTSNKRVQTGQPAIRLFGRTRYLIRGFAVQE